jgi:hypothetical protein
MTTKKAQELEPLDVALLSGLPAPVWAPPEVDGSLVSIVYRVSGEPIVIQYQIDEEIEILDED